MHAMQHLLRWFPAKIILLDNVVTPPPPGDSKFIITENVFMITTESGLYLITEN